MDTAELLVGVGVAAVVASFVELIQHQTGFHFRARITWMVPILRLPGQVLGDLVIVFAALWRRLAYGEQPVSGFVEVPKAWGDDSAKGVTRRVLLVAGTSVAPNTFVLGIDRERDNMVVHHLVLPSQQVVPGQREDGAAR